MSFLAEFLEDLRDDALDWCRGRSPWLRLGLLTYLLYGGVRHLADATYATWFAGITLAFHEMGHLVFAPFGRTLHFLGGSIFQVGVPLVAALYLLLRQRDFFGAAVGLCWLAFAEWEMATYMADANKERMALVGFSDHPLHDWGYLFTRWRVLNHCDTIAAVVRGVATLTWLGAIAIGLWLCWQMYQRGQRGLFDVNDD